MSDEELIPELGDRITILSQVFKSTTGRILYRDDSLIRVRPETRSTTAVDFPLDPESGLFLDTLGVKEVQIHEKRKHPAFAAQLAIFPQDQIQTYDNQGHLTDTVTVEAIYANESQDAIVVRRGTSLEVMDFGFLGTKDLVLVPIGNPEDLASEENKAEDALHAEEAPAEGVPELDDILQQQDLAALIPMTTNCGMISLSENRCFFPLLKRFPTRSKRIRNKWHACIARWMSS
jgi:hypothetical protein